MKIDYNPVHHIAFPLISLMKDIKQEAIDEVVVEHGYQGDGPALRFRCKKIGSMVLITHTGESKTFRISVTFDINQLPGLESNTPCWTFEIAEREFVRAQPAIAMFLTLCLQYITNEDDKESFDAKVAFLTAFRGDGYDVIEDCFVFQEMDHLNLRF